jgi:hypothetical protein
LELETEMAEREEVEDELLPHPPMALENEEESQDSAPISQLLGIGEENDDDPFKVQHVSSIFGDPARNKEITTETLGDLYFSQGQFERSLRIFEKLGGSRPSSELSAKIQACRAKLGVDDESLLRERKIDTLRGILNLMKTKPATQ